MVVAVGAVLLAASLAGPASAGAAEALRMYQVTLDEEGAATLGSLGVDLGETAYKPSVDRAQIVHVDLLDRQAATARDAGLALREVVPGPHVSAAQVENRVAAGAAAAKPETGGDSPNQFYDVFRSYSEPGGIKAEMTQLANAHRGIAKLVVIGQSGQGQDIVALKVTADARNVRDGDRPAMLFSAVNHAREWIAAEVGRRMPRWWLEHADDPQVAELLRRNELWFLPIQNPDGYDYTFTCGAGFRTANSQPCGATLVTDPADPLAGTYVYKTADGVTRWPAAAQPDQALRMPTQRLWRKTVRDNNGNGVFGDPLDGVDPNRNYPTAWGLDEEGASNNPQSGTYRGPYPLSEPEDLAYDRLLRKITPESVINYHSAAQLLLYPFGYITDVYADDDPWFKALTGTDGDAAVDPYISQRSSDLYITNGETTDHAYNKYRSMAWTPELDECETAAGGNFCTGGSGFTFPDDEGKVAAVFQKNLDFARNVAATTLDRDRPDRPRNATNDETQYQVKGSPDIEPNRFDVSYGADQTLEATARRILGPVDFVLTTGSGAANCATATRTATVRAAPWRGGERFGDLRGKYYQRVRATFTGWPARTVNPPPGSPQGTPPVQCPARDVVPGEIVEVRVIAGSQQQRFSYRVASLPAEPDARRVLVVAAEDYTGLSPNRDPYDDAPRYLDAHVAALEASGYEVETYDVDAPPAGPDGEPASKLVNDLGVLSHFDAVVFYTGDDLVPQAVGEGVTQENYRRGGPMAANGTFSLVGSTHLTNPGVRNAHMLRNYMNDGGKVLLAGRNLWVQQTTLQTNPDANGLNSYSGYSWWQDPVYDFDYPPNQTGDDDRPHTAFFRELDMPNDWGQWWLGFGHRTGGVGSTANAGQVVPAGAGLLAGMQPFALDTSIGSGGMLEPTEEAGTGRPDPRPKAPTRLRAISSQTTQRPFRQERIEADYAGQPNAFGGAIISTRDSVSVGFGLEQITDAAARQELVRRAMAHLLPAGPDAAPPTVSWLRPGEGATVNAADPVEIEVEAVDERGDMREVRLRVDGALVQTKVSFPFQLRWQPAAGDVGQSKTLVVEAEDAAGNVTTTTRTITVGPASGPEEAPLPTGVTTVAGTPAAGQTLTCVPSGFTGGNVTQSFVWLRDGTAIGGATGATYVATAADVGHAIACRVTGRNGAGDADSTSASVTISVAAVAGPPGPPGPRGPAGPRGPRGRTPDVRVRCELVRRDRIRCTVRTRGRAQATVRLAGTRRTASARGRDRFTVTLRSRRAVRRPARVVVRVQAGATDARGTVRTGRTARLTARR